MKKFGVLRGDIEDQYSKLGKAISGQKHSFVGIFYSFHENNKTTILYRTFDGTRITYFGNYMSVEELANNDLVSSIEIMSFNEENWLADGKKENLHDRFFKTINMVLLDSNAYSDYSSLLKSYVGIEVKNKIVNGYQIVNEIILKTIGINNNTEENSLDSHSKTLIENRYFNRWENKKSFSTEKFCLDQLNIEVRSCFSQLFQAFLELIMTDKEYSTRVFKLLENNKRFNGIIFSPIKSSLVPSILETNSENTKNTNTYIDDIEEEIGYFRDVILDIMNGFSTNKIPVIQVTELLDSYNQMAKKLNQPIIDHDMVKPDYKSVGVLAQATNSGFCSDDIEIKFNCGKSVILPAKNSSFNNFTYDQLIQILRYVRSLNSVDGRFNYMLKEIVKEVSLRAEKDITNISDF